MGLKINYNDNIYLLYSRTSVIPDDYHTLGGMQHVALNCVSGK